MAVNPNASLSTLEWIERIPRPKVRWCLLRNSNLPAPLLERLSEDKEILELMKRLNVPERFLHYLLVKKGKACKQAVEKYLARRHPSIKEWVLEGYARADAIVVRLIVLLHPNMPLPVLVEKSNSENWLERYAIAQNASTPIDIRRQLAMDANRVVRAAAKSKLA